MAPFLDAQGLTCGEGLIANLPLVSHMPFHIPSTIFPLPFLMMSISINNFPGLVVEILFRDIKSVDLRRFCPSLSSSSSLLDGKKHLLLLLNGSCKGGTKALGDVTRALQPLTIRIDK